MATAVAPVPAPVRRFLWGAFLRDPGRRQRLSGTVVVTSVGMSGTDAAWGIPLTDYSLCLTVGGGVRKPGMVRDHGGSERIEPREVLSLTISMDHDLIDGAPAARFAVRLKEIIESGAILARNREKTHKIQPSPDRQPTRDAVKSTVVEEREATGT